MKKQITRGKFTIDNNHIVNENSVIVAIAHGTSGKHIDVKEEHKANAELIAEAFNVTNESGFTPSELLAQRNELVNLVLQISTCETPKTISGLEHLLSSIKNNAIKVLSKCTMVCS